MSATPPEALGGGPGPLTPHPSTWRGVKMNEQLGIRSSLAEPGTRARHSRPATGHARLHALCSRLLNGAHRHAPCHTARSIGPDRDQSLSARPALPTPRCAPARPPRMRRLAHAHPPCPSPRAMGHPLPRSIVSQLLCPDSCRSRRPELLNEVLNVSWVRVLS